MRREGATRTQQGTIGIVMGNTSTEKHEVTSDLARRPHPKATTVADRGRELVILNATAAALNASVDLESSLRAALSSVAELLGLRTGWVLLLDDDGEPHLAAAQNLPPGLAADAARMAGSCYCLDTYRAGDLSGAANVRLVRCSRLAGLVCDAESERCTDTDALTSGLRYHASVPLYARGRRLGILNVATSDWRQLSDEDLRLLYTIGDLLSIAIERAKLYERSAELGAVEERNRIAREIHDTLAQGLAGITVQLETAEALLETGAEREPIEASVRHALEQARASLHDARRSVLELRTSPLEGRSLAEALEHLVASWHTATGIEARYDGEHAPRQLPARVEIGLYGIAREALANAGRHAAPSNVRVELGTATRGVRLVIEDDGRGFDPDSVGDGHFGLIGMRERARLLGGSIHVESAPAKGTRVLVEVPA